MMLIVLFLSLNSFKSKSQFFNSLKLLKSIHNSLWIYISRNTALVTLLQNHKWNLELIFLNIWQTFYKILHLFLNLVSFLVNICIAGNSFPIFKFVYEHLLFLLLYNCDPLQHHINKIWKNFFIIIIVRLILNALPLSDCGWAFSFFFIAFTTF